MNQILDTDESVLAQGLFDDRVVVERDPLSGDLGVTSLVDEFLDGLEVGLTIGGGDVISSLPYSPAPLVREWGFRTERLLTRR